MAIATGISTSVRRSNWRPMDAKPPVCAYSMPAYTTNATSSPMAATIAQLLAAASAEKSPMATMPMAATTRNAMSAAIQRTSIGRLSFSCMGRRRLG